MQKFYASVRDIKQPTALYKNREFTAKCKKDVRDKCAEWGLEIKDNKIKTNPNRL